jgi:hypothetical protein
VKARCHAYRRAGASADTLARDWGGIRLANGGFAGRGDGGVYGYGVKRRFRAAIWSRITVLPAGYRPSANEEFMGDEQLAYFRQKLLDWKDAIVRESRETMVQLKSGPMREADVTDRASSETDGRSSSAPATGSAN